MRGRWIARRWAALAVAALAASGPGLPAAAQGAGSGSSTVLRLPPAPRALSLANALVAVRDTWALEYNPAGAAVGATTIGAGFQTLPVGASAGAAVLAMPAGRRLHVGLSARFVDYGEIDVIEPDPVLPIGRPTGAKATGGELTTLVAAAVEVGPARIGLGARWLRLDVAGLVDDAVAADAGIALTVAPWLELAGSVQNLGGEMEAGQAAPLPRTVRGGVAVRRDVGSVSTMLGLEARRREARLGMGAGLELGGALGGVEAVGRIGFETRPDPGDAYSRLVFGGGVTVDRLSVDLAYRALGPLGSTRQVGLAYRF
jgi:hypothetical protein